MASLFIRADSIITIYDQRNVTPVRNAIRRETNQLDLPTYKLLVPSIRVPKPGAKTINFFRARLGAQLTICAQK